MKTLRIFAVCFLAVCGLSISASAQDIVHTVIGGGPSNIPAVDANIFYPSQVAVDASGNVYVASSYAYQVLKISTTGVVTVIAGNGFSGYSGDGGPGIHAELYNPQGVAVDGASPANVYIADAYNCVIRKVSQSTGIITTIAGGTADTSNGCGYSGDGGKASAAQMYYPGGLAINPATNDLYIADSYNGAIRKIAGGTATGTITTVAGGGGTHAEGANCSGSPSYGDGGAATSAYLCYPEGVALDTSVTPANVFITETTGSVCDVREVVGSSAKIYQVAGSYSLGCGFTDNVNALAAQFNQPYQLHVAVSGTTTTVQVADLYNDAIRQFTLTYTSAVPKPGTITTIAGGSRNGGGFCGDGGSALSACIRPQGIAYDASGNYYIGDFYNDRVRKVLKSNNDISTIGGWGQSNYSDPVGVSGVGVLPSLYYPFGVYADPASNDVYVGGYYNQAVYEWNSATNALAGFAGSGVLGFAGDGGKADAAAAELNYPEGIAKDSNGNVYIADANNCVIREVTASSADITTVLGGISGTQNGCGYKNGLAAVSQFNEPTSIAFDNENNMYISDTGNCAIRKLTALTSQVTTIAGSPASLPVCGDTGDGGPAIDAEISSPQQITLDGAGNIYFADTQNHRIREIVAHTGMIQTVAGDGDGGYNGDGLAVGRDLEFPDGVTSDPNGNLFISDTETNILRWVTPNGQMLTFAGTPPGGPLSSNGFSGDGGSALGAQFYYPQQIARDSLGNTYVADQYNYRIRQVTPFAGYGLSTASIQFPTQPAGTQSEFQPVTLSAIGPTTINAISITGGFSEVDDCAGQSLSTNQTCEIDVYFQPSSAGEDSGSLTISSNAFLAANPDTILLNGIGAGLSLSGSLAFGAQPLKTPVSHTLTLTNSGAAVKLSKIYLTSTTYFAVVTGTGGGTCPVAGGTLATGASCTIVVTFTPTVTGADKSTLVVTSTDPASPLLTGATGTGTEVKVSASSIAFGSISYGATATSNLTITNTGSTAFTLATSFSSTVFSVSSTGRTCTTSLAGGASCVLPVEYDPTAVGASTGTLMLTTNGGSNPVIALSGTATSDVSATPTSLAFGAIAPKATKVLGVTVTNTGTIASLTVKTAITGSTSFTVLTTGNTCTSVVAPGKTCTIPVQFDPAAAAGYSGTLTITTNGGANPTVSLSGTGS